MEYVKVMVEFLFFLEQQFNLICYSNNKFKKMALYSQSFI